MEQELLNCLPKNWTVIVVDGNTCRVRNTVRNNIRKFLPKQLKSNLHPRKPLAVGGNKKSRVIITSKQTPSKEHFPPSCSF